VKLKTSGKKVLEIYSSDSALGENNYLVPVKIDGPETQMSFNWRYLLDGIKALSGEQIVLGLNGENKPAIVKSSEDISYFYIVMPIKQ